MDYEALESLFVSDTSKAIEESRKLICSNSKFDSFEDFFTYHQSNEHFNYCPIQFSAKLIPRMSVYCIGCAKSDSLSLICLPCFLNGNHEGHNYFIFPGFAGICSCENCTKHHGDEKDDFVDNYLDKSLKNVLTNVIFQSAFNSIQKVEKEKASLICDFIVSLLNLGDGFRRLFAKAITENAFELILNVNESPSTEILNIFSYLMHDKLFMRNLSKSVISFACDKAIKNASDEMMRQSDSVSPNYEIWYQFIYSCFSFDLCRFNIEKNSWNWIDFSIELLKQYKKLIFFFKNYKYTNYPLVFNLIKYIHYATSIQPNDETQVFFDKIFSEVFNTGVNEANDTIIVDTYKKYSILTQIDSYLDFLKTFGDLMFSFKSKENLKFEKLIEELEKSIDITPIFMISRNSIGSDNGKNNENDKLISRFIIKKDEPKSIYSYLKSKVKSLFTSYPSKYYKSFYNGASFFICNPLYDSFSMLFRVDDLCRIKIARFLCQEKYQTLRVKLGIITLKKILSVICFKMHLVQFRNLTILLLLEKIFDDKAEIIYNLIPVSVFQLLIGLKCIDKTPNKSKIDEFILKEFFSFELAREIGLFDEKTSNKKEMLVFTFLYVSLMIVIDRNLFNYEYKKILEEQIIFALKKGVHSIDELHDIFKSNLDNPREYFTLFNEIIMKVAKNSTKEDIIYDDSNIILQSFSDMKSNSDDEYSDNDYDDNENVKDKVDIKNILNDNKKNAKKNKNQESYIKPIKFYLKDEIECKAISAVNPIDDQRSYLNIEISNNFNKLLKIQHFEPEETFFFHSNQENSINTNGLSIQLKLFLQTPTILATIYDTLRSNLEINPYNSNLNDHLSMNILILISKFIIEESNNLEHITSTLNSQTIIEYSSLLDLISKLKRVVFNYRSSGKDIDEKGFIENTLNSSNFISFLKMKFEPKNLPPKSIIDILKEKGKLGQDVLHQISSNIQVDFLIEKENKIKEQNIKTKQKIKVNKIKEDILNQFSNLRNHYHFTESISESLSCSGCFITSNKEVCSFCSEAKKKEILCYPLYMYRTKFPFVIDKPPLVSSEKVDDIAVYDNEEDIDKDFDIDEFIRNELEIKDDEKNEEKKNKFFKCKKMILNIIDQQKKEKEELKIQNEKMKRVACGANFVVQYGICPHPFHRSCANEDQFVCPIDRSKKNGFLPFLEDIPTHIIFKDMKTFELNSTCEKDNSLSSNVLGSISAFINKFKSFFDCLNDNSLNVFIELIKSISGLIETYEIRVRNLPDSLDSIKSKILAHNLFLAVWYAYRIQKKPKIMIISKNNSNEIDTDSRLTDFQKFIKLLIEYDDINNQNLEIEVKKIIHSIIESMVSQNQEKIKRKEKEICLFLRRVCLAEYFLLDINVKTDIKPDLIDWDEVLTAENLSKRYDFKFMSIDVSLKEEFEFKPFLFIKYPKEYLRLSENPYNLPISDVLNASMFNILDYNYLIKNYDDFDEQESSIHNDNENRNDEVESNNKNIYINDEIKRYSRNVYFCDTECLPFILHFIGKFHYPSILMFTGVFSSQIFLVDQLQCGSLDTPYVDKSGCPDIGHIRMQPLFFNEERYEILVDQILSGDFSYKLSSIEKNESLFTREIESSDLF